LRVQLEMPMVRTYPSAWIGFLGLGFLGLGFLG
jgi:hypothetical protein